MRDKNRCEPFCNELAQIWKINFPDWRFGQLMYNFLSTYGDPFFWEEDKFLENLKDFTEKNSKWG